MFDWNANAPATRWESHFGDRIVRCFAKRPKTLQQLLERNVAKHGAAEAYVCEDRRLTWAEFGAEVERLAGGLAGLGIGKGDRVAMLMANRIEFVSVMFAAIRLGAIIVPLSVRAQRPEITYMVQQSGAAVIIHENGLADRLPLAGDCPALRHRVPMDRVSGTTSWADLIDTAPVPPADLDEEDTVVILYTSGTSGRPKGAMLAHINIIHAALHVEFAVGLTEMDRCVVPAPLNHVTGVVSTISIMLNCAGALIIQPQFKAPLFLEAAASERMTLAIMVPAMYNLLLLQPDFDKLDLSSWTAGVFGGSPMAETTIAKLADRLPNLRLMNTYGATESSGVASFMPPHLTAAHRDSAGFDLPCARLVVMDDDGIECAPGETGEIWIGGASIANGYWGDVAGTKANFTAGFWHSGDLGSIDENGLVRVVDRKKDIVNRGGLKIFTIEVEHVLCQHEAVIEAAVVAKPDPVLGERVHAFVAVRRPGVTAQDLAAFCAPLLSDYKVPESFTITEELLPRNPNGKVLKRDLRDTLVLTEPRNVA